MRSRRSFTMPGCLPVHDRQGPRFAVRDLAIGCLQKPYREEDLVRALTEAEDILKGRQKPSAQRLPEQLEIYGDEEEADEPAFVLHGRPNVWVAKLKSWCESRHPSGARHPSPDSVIPAKAGIQTASAQR